MDDDPNGTAPGPRVAPVDPPADLVGWYWDPGNGPSEARMWADEDTRNDFKAIWLERGFTEDGYRNAIMKLNMRIADGVERVPLDPGLRLVNWLQNYLHNEKRRMNDE